MRWQKKRFRDYWRKTSKPGRPCIDRQHIDFIRRNSGDHPEYGEDRIAIEMKIKLGIKHSEATVRKFMVKPSRVARSSSCPPATGRGSLQVSPANSFVAGWLHVDCTDAGVRCMRLKRYASSTQVSKTKTSRLHPDIRPLCCGWPDSGRDRGEIEWRQTFYWFLQRFLWWLLS